MVLYKHKVFDVVDPGFSQKQYDCATLAFLVLINSINYWRNPVFGWRRT